MSTSFFNSISIGVLKAWISGLCLSLMNHFVKVLILLVTSSNFQITRHWIHSQTFFSSFLSLNKKNQQKAFNVWSEFLREINFCYYCGPHFYFEIKIQMTQPQESQLISLKKGNMARKVLDSLV